MINSLLRNTNLGHLRSLVSPAFFDVVPTRMLWTEGRQLLKNYRDRDGFEQALSLVRDGLRGSALQVQLAEAAEPAEVPTDPASYAQQVVALYFHQLFSDGPTVIDLRASALSEQADGLAWHPAPMWTTWEVGFRSAIREVYLGYYGDDDARFRQGLAGLGLEDAAALFRAHFGDANATPFELESFINNFHAIFVHCRDHKVTLPGDFLALGVYLATMYENLDRLDVVVNARQCFEEAVGP